MSESEATALYLTEVQRQTLDLKRQNNIAMTVLAWVMYAEKNALADEEIKSGVTNINILPLAKLKKLRKALASATVISELLPYEATQEIKSPPLEASETTDHSILVETALAEPVTEAVDLDMLEQDIILDLNDKTLEESINQPHPELSNVGKIWALKLLGLDYDFSNKSAADIAEDIYIKAGSPKTRKQPSGTKIVPVERIMLKLKANTLSEISSEIGVAVGALSGWYTNSIEKNIRVQSQKDDPEQRTPIERTPRVVEETRKASVVTPLVMPTQRKVEQSTKETIDHTFVATEWAKIIKLNENNFDAFSDIFDPKYSTELGDLQKKSRHIFREYIKRCFHNLDHDALNLSNNQTARLNELLGRVKTPEGYKYTGPLSTVGEVSRENGYFVAQRRDETLSALTQLLYVANPELEQGSTEEDSVDELELLLNKGFSPEELEALRICLTLDEEGEYKLRSDTTRSALAKLQKLLAKNGARLRMADERLHPSLTMLTSTMFGVKTLEDVYYKLHSKDQSTRREDISDLIKNGVAIIAK